MRYSTAIARSLACVVACFLLCAAGQAAARPNLLLIIADDYATDGLALYNSNKLASLPPTPNLNRLRDQGVLFHNAYAYPTCSPTRCSILTGRYGYRTGIGYALEKPSEPTLAGYEHCLPEVLDSAQSGYRHAMVGKWHLSFHNEDPNQLGGFAHFSGGILGALPSYYNWPKTIDGTNYSGHNVYATKDNAEDAIAWLEQQKGSGQNWFLWLAFNASHTPYHKPPTNMCPSYARLSALPAQVDQNPRAYYEAITEAMDTAIGSVLDRVDLKTTTVILLGDNGTLGQVKDDSGNAIPIIQPPYSPNHGKGTLYEGGIRIPLIIAGAGVANPGGDNYHLVHSVDLFATILELAGVNPAQAIPSQVAIDSRSLAPVLRDPAAPPARDWVLSENFAESLEPEVAGRCLRDSQYKLIAFSDGRSEFYDLSADPFEAKDLLAGTLTGEQSERLASLRRQLANLQNVPQLRGVEIASDQAVVRTAAVNGTEFALWRSLRPEGPWEKVNDATARQQGDEVLLADPSSPTQARYYQVSAPER